ncbi:hypothetical protein D9757_009975 [Collybiopsis confluens]|uniref:Chromo domain-containing protein n=1 Tax=Collybiopsis confluens TaxID=2823264 RepID=A0A8H5GUH3_9AGAR|nr:hypothetical protein D9757_009975 [Collybiopsis confluens]
MRMEAQRHFFEDIWWKDAHMVIATDDESQFVPRPDDSDNLWEVVAIVDETAKQFKVQWAGTDPATGKPWPDSWAAKGDVTNDAVQTWRESHPRISSVVGRNRKGTGKGRSRTRAASIASMKYISRSKSYSVDPLIKRELDVYDEPPTAGPSKPRTKKRKHSPENEEEEEEEEYDNNSNNNFVDDSVSATLNQPRKKKRKVSEESSPGGSESDEEEEDRLVRARNGNGKTKGKEKTKNYSYESESESEAKVSRHHQKVPAHKQPSKSPSKSRTLTTYGPGAVPNNRAYVQSPMKSKPSTPTPASKVKEGRRGRSGTVDLPGKKTKKNSVTPLNGDVNEKEQELPASSKTRKPAKTTLNVDDLNSDDEDQLPATRPKQHERGLSSKTKKPTTFRPKPKPQPISSENNGLQLGRRTVRKGKPGLEYVETDEEERRRSKPKPKLVEDESEEEDYVQRPTSVRTSKHGLIKMLYEDEDIDDDEDDDTEPDFRRDMSKKRPHRNGNSGSLPGSSEDEDETGMEGVGEPVGVGVAIPDNDDDHPPSRRTLLPKESSFVFNPNSPLAQTTTPTKSRTTPSPQKMTDPDDIVPLPPLTPSLISKMKKRRSTSGPSKPHTPTPVPPLVVNSTEPAPVSATVIGSGPSPAPVTEQQASSSSLSASRTHTAPQSKAQSQQHLQPRPENPLKSAPPSGFPLLSPGALLRLKEFDDFLTSVPVKDVTPPSPLPVVVEDGQGFEPELEPAPKPVSPIQSKPDPTPNPIPAHLAHPIEISGTQTSNESSIVPETDPGNLSQGQSQLQSQFRQKHEKDGQVPEQEREQERHSAPPPPPFLDPFSHHSPPSPPPPLDTTELEKVKRPKKVVDDLDHGLSRHDLNISVANVKAESGARKVARKKANRGGSGGDGAEGGSGSGDGAGPDVHVYADVDDAGINVNTNTRISPHSTSIPTTTNAESDPNQRPKPKKKLGPIPVVSPSKFGSHLLSSNKISERNDTDAVDDTIDQWPSPVALNGKGQSDRNGSKLQMMRNSLGFQSMSVGAVASSSSAAAAMAVDMDDDVLMNDRIPQVKPPATTATTAMTNAVTSSQDSEVLALQIRTRGHEIAEARRRQQRIELGLEPLDGRKKRSLDDIMAESDAGQKEKGKEREGKRVERHAERRQEIGEMMEDLAPENVVEMAGNDVTSKVGVDKGQDDDPELMGSYELQYPEESQEADHVLVHSRPRLSSAKTSAAAGPSGVRKGVDDEDERDALQKKLTLTTAQLEAYATEIRTLNRRLEEVLQQNSTLQRELADANAVLAKQSDEPALPPRSHLDELESKIEQLETDVASARAASTSAGNDRDFFREQYTTVSVFATETRDSNVQLLKRAEIAERQATEGVALVKASFEEKLRISQEQCNTYLSIVEFLMKKDAATDGVRKDAAEAPELRVKIGKLEQDLVAMKEETAQLESACDAEGLKAEELERRQEERDAEWKKTVEEFRREVARLMVELNDAKSSQREDSTAATVFQCQWRNERSERCLFVCGTKEQLEDHIIHGGHVVIT